MRSPSFEPVRHLLTPAGYLPSADAKIVWATDAATGRVRDVAVIANPMDVSPVLRARLRAADDPTRWPHAHGNCVAGWMEAGQPTRTPEGLFAHWEREGFTSDDERHRALTALGRLAECGWARRMAAAIEEENELAIAA